MRGAGDEVDGDALAQLVELGRALPWHRPDADRREAMRAGLLAAADDTAIAPAPGARRWIAIGGAAALAAAAALAVMARGGHDAAPAGARDERGGTTADRGGPGAGHDDGAARAAVTVRGATPVAIAVAPAPGRAADFERVSLPAADGGVDDVVRLRSGRAQVAVPLAAAAAAGRARVETGDAEVDGDGAYVVAAQADALAEVRVARGEVTVRVKGQVAVFLSAGDVWRPAVDRAALVDHAGVGGGAAAPTAVDAVDATADRAAVATTATATATTTTTTTSSAHDPATAAAATTATTATTAPAITPPLGAGAGASPRDGAGNDRVALARATDAHAAPSRPGDDHATTDRATAADRVARARGTDDPASARAAAASADAAADRAATAATTHAPSVAPRATNAPRSGAAVTDDARAAAAARDAAALALSAGARAPTEAQAAPSDRAPTELEEHFAAGWRLLRAQKFVDAARELGAAVATGGDAPLVEDARYLQAVALARAGRAGDAEHALTTFLDRNPRSLRRGRAAVMLGWLLAGRGERVAARGWFEAAAADPDADVAAAARAGLAGLAAR